MNPSIFPDSGNPVMMETRYFFKKQGETGNQGSQKQDCFA